MAYHREPDEEVADALAKLTFKEMCDLATDLQSMMIDAGHAKIEIMELGSFLSAWADARQESFRERIEAEEVA